MKIKLIITTILLVLSNVVFAQQKYDVYPITSQYPVTFIRDISFVDLNTGYLTAEKIVQGINETNYIFKTTNGGENWFVVWDRIDLPNSKKISASYINANTGYISKRTLLIKTTNGGQNWTNLATSGLSDADNLICTRSNEDVLLIQPLTSRIYKYSNSANTFQLFKDFGSDYRIEFIEISKTNDYNIYICGYHYFSNNNVYRPFFAKSTDAGSNWSIIIDGEEDIYSTGILKHMSVTSDGTNDVVKISGVNKLIEYKNNQVNVLNINWTAGNRISFSDANNGYYLKYDGAYDDPPQSTGLQNAYKTTDGGMNWVSDLELSEPNHFFNTSYRFYTKGNIVYFTESVQTDLAYFRVRNLYENFRTYFDNISTTGSFKINNINYSTPQSLYFRGGNYSLWTEAVLNENQTEEKIFYRWSMNKMLNSISNYDLIYEGELAANYKTKQKSTDETGISNTCQTKTFRDSEGKYHQIHSSIGGIFYTLSQSSTSGFGREEVVNGGALYSQQFPNAGTCDLNKNPSINEISFIGEGDVIPNSMSVTAVWERYNQQTNKTDILSALRSTDVNNPWTRFGNNLNALDGKIISFNSTINYNSKPDVYSFYISGEGSEVNSYMMLVPHLEPSQNGNKLVVSARYKNYTGFDYEAIRIEEPPYETNDFVIVSDNVSDYSVTYKPYLNSNNYKSVYLYFTYKKNGNIYYRRESINITSSYNIYRDEIPLEEREYNVSSNDNQTLRNSPDITLRNNLPAVTYQGRNDVYRIVYFDGSEGEQNIQLHYYPILVKMRDANGNWLSYNYNSNGFQTQENPDIEGSVDYDALLINFSKASTTFYQFAKINGLTGYSCSPGYYPGKDAKLIKGSYIGQFGTNSNPGLLTLSNPVNSLYSVGRQLFVITNAPSDGYSNMDGTIEKENILYTLTLGPIIASNTTQGFEDDAPPQTVQNAVEFNETMVSAPFTLSNNDTLILGAHGKYLPSFGQAMEPMKYHVNLIDSATNQIHSELFSDTINVEDSVGIEFLRGFVINNISGGTGRFYVQLLVDTADAGDGDYMMAGVYSDNTLPGGDAPINYRTKVFFKNSSNSLKHDNQIPKSYELSQNYPNPFNPVTKINYALPKQGFVTLKIYDITGREVKVLVNEFRQAGYYTVDFNGSNLASGVYFYRIQSNDFIHTKRMVLIK